MEDDIQIVEMRSLGRGRGFEVVSRESALDDPELTSTIAARLRVLLRLLDDEGTETRDVRGEKEEVASLRREENELEAQLANSDEENEELKALEASVENCLRLLNNHLGESFDNLEEAVEYLVENKG
jgi:polysaccharide deacetylase 2 family uncharacterized protein YibQ